MNETNPLRAQHNTEFTLPPAPFGVLATPDAIPLTAHLVRFTVVAESEIVFHDFKGSALRGALADCLRRTFCPEWRADRTDPLHQALCPICQLLSWEGDEETSGDVRRPYALQPPLVEQKRFTPGDSFSFGLTLFGAKQAYLPYLVLAVQGVGQTGVGQVNDRGQRGRFRLDRIDAVNPLTGAMRVMLAPGSNRVNAQTEPVTHVQVLAAADALADRLRKRDNLLTLQFLTPLRVTQDDHTTKTPEFFPLVKAVARRVLDLSAQHAGRRPADVVLKRDLYPTADAVRLVEDATAWWDLTGYSGRLRRSQQLGGYVGAATYHVDDWSPLLPWLIWGSVTQVGKNIVKGCGLYQVGVASKED